jgi:hypothetical protein
MSSETEKPRLTLMVSSTVYGIEELLEKIYATLTAFGYEVWMSHKGTLHASSTRTAFENCLHGLVTANPDRHRTSLGRKSPHPVDADEAKPLIRFGFFGPLRAASWA